MRKKGSLYIVCALIISVMLGLLLENRQDIADVFKPLGTIYINLIKLVMVPLVFSSLIIGINNVTDIKKVGKIGLHTIIIFLSSTAVAVIIGLMLSNIFKTGTGINIPEGVYEVKEMPAFSEVIVSIFPSNALGALFEANMLQIILLSVLVGIALVQYGKSNILEKGISELYDITSIVMSWIMKITPIGILGLLIPTVANNGISVILPLIRVVGVFYLAVMIHICITYVMMIKIGAKGSVRKFFKSIFPAMIIAFSSCSSVATLPVSMQKAQDELKLSKEVSGLVLPLGATINMDGNALYQGIVALFIAQAYGIDLSLQMQLMVVVTGVIASIGAAGVPGAGMIVLSTVLMSVGLPVDGIVLVAGIDRILDMGRTVTNITGDLVTACIVERINAKEGI